MPTLMPNYTDTSLNDYSRPTMAIYSEFSEKPKPSPSITVNYGLSSYFNYKIFQLLNEIEELKDGWDMEGAKAPTLISIQKAKTLVNLLSKSSQPIFHIAPGPDGEILIDIRNEFNTKSIEILLYDSKSLFVKFFNGDTPIQGVFEYEIIPELLNSLNH